MLQIGLKKIHKKSRLGTPALNNIFKKIKLLLHQNEIHF